MCGSADDSCKNEDNNLVKKSHKEDNNLVKKSRKEDNNLVKKSLEEDNNLVKKSLNQNLNFANCTKRNLHMPQCHNSNLSDQTENVSTSHGSDATTSNEPDVLCQHHVNLQKMSSGRVLRGKICNTDLSTCSDANVCNANLSDISDNQSCMSSSKYNADDKDTMSVINQKQSSMTKDKYVCIKGNFHQGDAIFFDNSGKQCVSNSLVSYVYSQIKSLAQWQRCDLDNVLQIGNDLYSTLQGSTAVSESLLLVNELPQALELFGKIFILDVGESITGVLCKTTETIMPSDFIMSLDEALCSTLDQFEASFVNFASSTFMVIKSDGFYFVFDSHSRNVDGLLDPDGSSILLRFRSLYEVYQHSCSLAASMNIHENCPFEVTGINVKGDGKHKKQNKPCAGILKSDIPAPSNDVVGGETEKIPIHFNPLTSKTCDDLCQKFRIDNEHNPTTINGVCQKDIGEPCERKVIMGDGNCFFRALSFVISGTESNHDIMRQSIVKHLAANPKTFQGYIRPRFKSIKDYIKLSWIEKENTWATEVEIFVAAHLLEIDLYTFSENAWLRFPCSRKRNVATKKEGIYLDHYHQCHYNVVLSVKEIIAENILCPNVESAAKSKDSASYTSKRMSAEQYDGCGKKIKLCENSTANVKCKASKSKRSKQKSRRNYIRAKRAMKCDENIAVLKQRMKQVLQKERETYRLETEFANKKKMRSAEKYKLDKLHRDSVKEASIEKYATNLNFKEKVKAESMNKYSQNERHRSEMKSASKRKYAEDDEHKMKKKSASKIKYAEDDEHKMKKKSASKIKYAEDDEHKMKKKSASKIKYAEVDEHKRKVKSTSKNKYTEDYEFRQKSLHYKNEKYKSNETHRQTIKEENKRRQLQKKIDMKTFENAHSVFLEEIAQGPEFICSVCFRRLFLKQVIECKRAVYVNKGGKVHHISVKCISESHVHKCSSKCADKGDFVVCPASKLWICHTCHRKILSGNMPAEALSNNLHLDPIPVELRCLNNLEEHLIALNIPFMKVVPLPKGGQNGFRGPVVCVPSNIEKTTSILPKCAPDDHLIMVKLKRKLVFKGHHKYQFVNNSHIRNALDYLMRHNIWYKDVKINKDWMNPLPPIDEVDEDMSSDCNDSDATDENENDTTFENTCKEKPVNLQNNDQSGLLMDTCLQPVDIGQEILDQNFEKISCVAPAESNVPVNILMDETNEAKSFPFLFPTGKGTFHEPRKEKLSLSKYLSNRLMNADGRFAQNTEYIFYAQYLSEFDQVKSKVSIAMRKGSQKYCNKKVTSETLTDAESLRSILKSDEGYRFLRPIRGTPPFWQCVQKDLFAMIRQLGIPTWFCSFSSADLRWTEILKTIMKEEGNSCNVDDLDWSQKCAILRKNPVTAARMFDHRFHSFLKKIIMSPAQPIGEIIDYFYRVEFQQRGSPHTHCLFWVRDAPKVDKHDDDIVTAFVDQYVSCELPNEDEDPELHDIVNTVQKHSKSHSKSCKKGGTNCRFNFPRPPSENTFISHAGIVQTEPEIINNDNLTLEAKVMSKQEAKSILLAIWSKLSDKDKMYDSVGALFADLETTQDVFEQACSTIAKKTSLVLKRQPQDVWINQYNPDLLRCWNANMDIQYVVDAYSCVVYIISYISKAEREMGILLSHAEKEATKYGNTDARTALKKLGNMYLHNREVGAQEAIYRVCHMKLKEGSRKVEFIPVGPNPIRMSKPLHLLKHKEQDPDDIWMTSIIDRYKNRPIGGEFDEICLASFCSEYRTVSKAEITRVDNEKRRNPVFELQNGLGYVQKRSRTDPAVVRYPRFSPTKDSEKYYHSILQLFLPHRCNSHLKPSSFNLFENFYEIGAVKLGNELQTVKIIVDNNRMLFEKEADVIYNAERLLETIDELQDAWAQICPETEADRLECTQSRKELESDDNNEDHVLGDNPDLLPRSEQCLQSELNQNLLSKEEAYTILRTLNDEQRTIFYAIRQWCLDKRNKANPEPFHLFVTGGAGTGKSHLIKAIYYEASRLLAPMLTNPDDVSVLLTAPTGVAAFNIGASTIHSALSIGIDVKLPYVPLGEEKVNTLRAKLGNLHILIIDEISMVDKKLFAYVHGRLRQIKQTGDYSPFGRVSVIAVGDFYQLPPVKGKPLYSEHEILDFWNDCFRIAELTKIMRQRDSNFAEMLNRLRVRKKCETLAQKDLEMLSSCETNEDSNAIHIFATNNQVDDFNVTMLNSCCEKPFTIESEDYSRNPNTGKLEKRHCHHVKVARTTLVASLNMGVGARVLMTKNVDVADGLVNGVFGTVCEILFGPNKKFPEKVYVVFDNEKVGMKIRKKTCHIPGQPERSTPIEAQEETVTNNGGVRRQFPLKLAWACTVHKVQGLTVKEAVVSLSKIFAPGQAYVALSRVTSLEGLTIQSFKDSTIYCNENVQAAMASLSKFIPEKPYEKESNCCIILHNIEGLASHFKDIQSDKRFLAADVICLTETWLSDSHFPCTNLDGFVFHGKSRRECYETTLKMFSELQSQSHGGVGVFLKNTLAFDILDSNVPNMEYITFYEREHKVAMAVIYRPPSYKVTVFRKKLMHLIDELTTISPRMIIMGDFNENVLQSSSIATCMESYGFQQHVSQATTESGTRIDHVYVKGIEMVFTESLPTYFSFHEAIVVKI